MSNSEDHYVESQIPEMIASEEQPHANSQEQSTHSSSPKRVKLSDSSVHSSDLPEHDTGSGDELSAASSNDEPISQAEASDVADELPEHAYTDEGFRDAVKKGLINLKSALTRKEATYMHKYTLYKVDDDLADDFLAWVCENLIDWEKFVPSEQESEAEDLDE